MVLAFSCLSIASNTQVLSILNWCSRERVWIQEYLRLYHICQKYHTYALPMIIELMDEKKTMFFLRHYKCSYQCIYVYTYESSFNSILSFSSRISGDLAWASFISSNRLLRKVGLHPVAFSSSLRFYMSFVNTIHCDH